jgi:hypothetical protein
MAWTLHRGESDPPLGWFSPSFDVKLPSYSLLGAGAACASFPLVSRLAIQGAGRHDRSPEIGRSKTAF